MNLSRTRGLTIAAAAAAITLGVVAPAGAKKKVSHYHPTPEVRAFTDSAAGWKGSYTSGGPCDLQLLCPSIDNRWQSSGGSPGGYLRSTFGPLLGVGGEETALWKSPTFTYRGASGKFATDVTFDLDHRSNVDSLLSVAGDEADFTVDLVDAATNSAIKLTGPTTLANASVWTAIDTAKINPDKLKFGRKYFFRISSRISFGADFSQGSTADYDNVDLTAKQVIDREPCSTPIEGTAKPDKLRGTDGGDEIKAHGGADDIQALKGDDCIDGGSGRDHVSGSGGDDTIHGNQAGDVLHGGAGRDTIAGGAGNDKIRGATGGDTIKGASGNDEITGAKGRDEIHGAGGNDTLKGGADPDKLSGGAGSDVILGLKDDDRLSGSGGQDVLRGGGGRDVINAGAGADKVTGGAGRDTIRARGNGRDTIKCGPGKDTVYADRHDSVGASCEHVIGGR